jgi:hypothetical protein
MGVSDIVARSHHKKGVVRAGRLATLDATAKGSAAKLIDNPGPDLPVARVAHQGFRQFWQFLIRAFFIFGRLRCWRRDDGRVLLSSMVIKRQFVDKRDVANCQY